MQRFASVHTRAGTQTHTHTARPLTQKVVPLGVQVGLVGQAAAHHVETVVLARLEGHLAGAVGTVEHLHGRSHTAGGGADLQEKERRGGEGGEDQLDCCHCTRDRLKIIEAWPLI